MKETFLIMVTAESNHNKYYRMVDNENGSFTVEFGRVGASCQKKDYPISQWNSKYNEKIRKGYVDQTHLYAKLPEEAKKEENLPQIVEELQRLAKQQVSNAYSVDTRNVSNDMIVSAQTLIYQLTQTTDLSTFNEILNELFVTIPRRMSDVRSYLASSMSKASDIICREQDLLDVMKGQVVQYNVTKSIVDGDTSLLDQLGLSFEDVTDDTTIDMIKSHLGSESSRFYKAWKVTNKKTEEAFKKKAKGKKTMLLWHGSRNENWWSICQTGLILRPTNVVISGKMFGYGIYFAPKAKKSLGYTSLDGSYWARGNSSKAYMALFECVYGTPLNVYDYNYKYGDYDLEALKQNGNFDCLHAHAGASLRNDEIIFYDEKQLTIRYLVEIH